MLTILEAVILGIVEGITEFLPVSSTAHLILTSELLGIPQSDYVKSFEIIIQLGAILAIVWLYRRRILDLELWKKVAVAFVPTGILGLLLYKAVKQYLLGNVTVVLSALALGGLLLILLERSRFARKNAEPFDPRTVSYAQCLVLGLFQAIAMIPGVSRSAATIVGGLMMGIPRRTIVEFSFLLAIPTMAAATGLDLLKSAGTWDPSQTFSLAVGFVTAFLTAIFAVKWLLKYVEDHTFTAFGVYRLILAAAFLFLFWL